jgi:two-component system, sensor histidine kinase and response regulator
MLGYTPDQLLGQEMRQMIHYLRPDQSPYPENECPIYQSTVYGKSFTADNEIFWRRDGTPFPILYTAFPILENGLIRGTVVTFNEIHCLPT